MDWVGLNGIRHQGRSGESERILVKGDPGMAVLRVLAFDRHHRMVQVAHATFEVTAPELRAD